MEIPAFVLLDREPNEARGAHHGQKLLELEGIQLGSFSSIYCVILLRNSSSMSCCNRDGKGSRTVYVEGVLNSRLFYVFQRVESQDDAFK